MKHQKNIYFKLKNCLILFAIISLTASCKEEEEEEVSISFIKPMEFPNNMAISDFKFPEDSTTIYKWLSKKDTVNITKHAWGIWAGLTEPTGQKYNDQELLVFETWLGVKELAEMSANRWRL
jgi:hypothetical protein